MLERFKQWFKTRTFAGRTWQRYNDYVELCLTSGYIPKLQPWLIPLSRLVFQLWHWLQLGRLRIFGREHLNTSGRVIFCPNHSSLFDAVVVHAAMKRPVRYMGAYESMRGFLGIKTVLLAAMGVYPVDRSRGSSVLKPATELLKSGQPLMIFPEGKIDNTGTLGTFKLGAAYICLKTYAELKQMDPVGLIPVYIHYRKRNVKTGNSFNFLKMAFSWRGGVDLHLGSPIWLHEHPGLNAQELMLMVKERIARFQSDAQQRSKN